MNFMFARNERLNIPHEAGSVSSSFWLILAVERKIIRSGEWWIGANCACARVNQARSESGKKAEFLAELHRLRSSSRPEFVENTAGMGLHRALAHKKLFGDFAVAQALGDQFQDLKLTARDVKVFTLDRKSTRLNSSHITRSRMPSSA